MKNGVYLITGVSGFIGGMLVRRLLDSPAYHQGGIKIIGISRTPPCLPFDCAPDLNNSLTLLRGDLLRYDSCLSAVEEASVPPDYIIHCAAPTRSAFIAKNPVETIDALITGTKNVLEMARVWQVKSAVYLSSMEIYGRFGRAAGERTGENALGSVPLFQARSSYPIGKRAAEHICYAYFEEYGVPVKIARLAQIFGAGILPGENRVFAQFADAVRKRRDIVLHTPGTSVGNYCSIDDAIDAIVLLLERGKNGEAYNVVNEQNTMTICEMANFVAETVAHGEIQVVYSIPEGNPYGYAEETDLQMSSKKLEALGWTPKVHLEEMYRSLIKYMDETHFE